MRTSGLVLDVYDDVHGDVIRGLFSTYEAVPELLKTAQAIIAANFSYGVRRYHLSDSRQRSKNARAQPSRWYSSMGRSV